MCRFLLFQGRSPRKLSEFLVDPKHALAEQALAPRELELNLPSADGWGVSWYEAASSAPAVYRCVLPMWRDNNLHTLTPHVSTRHCIAATRVATGETELSLTSVQPFVHERLSFAHNGELSCFERAFLKPIRERLSDSSQGLPRAVTDSAHLFALWVDLMSSAKSVIAAAEQLIDGVHDLCELVGHGAKLNLLLSDGHDAVAVRYATAGEKPPSLYWRALSDGIVVASEPLDPAEPGWQSVNPNTRLAFREGELMSERRY